MTPAVMLLASALSASSLVPWLWPWSLWRWCCVVRMNSLNDGTSEGSPVVGLLAVAFSAAAMLAVRRDGEEEAPALAEEAAVVAKEAGEVPLLPLLLDRW